MYLYYDRAEAGEGRSSRSTPAFFASLPRYKRGDVRLVRPTFGYIRAGRGLTPTPPRPPYPPRVVLVGDAAARQSPLTYCGFGATLAPWLLGPKGASRRRPTARH